jgi:hypothetical protein
MHEDLVQFFKTERDLFACTDIDGLMQTLNINNNPPDWRLFIDSYKLSLKAVLHNGNTLVSFFIYCCTMHFDNIEILFTNKCTLY